MNIIIELISAKQTQINYSIQCDCLYYIVWAIISYKEDEFSIEVLNDSLIVQTLLENMISLLKELESTYPDNIKFL